MKLLSHTSVLLGEILEYLPSNSHAKILDVTAGGGGHFFAMLGRAGVQSEGWCWDQDPAAELRIRRRAREEGCQSPFHFAKKNFREAPAANQNFDFILADLGISSFQLDDPERGMSLHSQRAVDFRMDPQSGEDFSTWIRQKSVEELTELFANYGEEPRAAKMAKIMKSWTPASWATGEKFAAEIAGVLAYKSPSRIHPATRVFQALRIAINDELGALTSLLQWAPRHLNVGGRLAIISFHSLEDRFVKKAFGRLEESGDFDSLTKKPILPSEAEEAANPRARSAKLRVLQRVK